jgi:hypothetical protein
MKQIASPIPPYNPLTGILLLCRDTLPHGFVSDLVSPETCIAVRLRAAASLSNYPSTEGTEVAWEIALPNLPDGQSLRWTVRLGRNGYYFLSYTLGGPVYGLAHDITLGIGGGGLSAEDIEDAAAEYNSVCMSAVRTLADFHAE